MQAISNKITNNTFQNSFLIHCHQGKNILYLSENTPLIEMAYPLSIFAVDYPTIFVYSNAYAITF